MTHLQRRSDYGVKALHDEELEYYLHNLKSKYLAEPTFVETLREIAFHYGENPPVQFLIGMNMDFDTIPTQPNDFFRNLLVLARVAPHTAAACLDSSSIDRATYKAATGGIKETNGPYKAAFFIDRYVSRVCEMEERERRPLLRCCMPCWKTLRP